MTVSNGKFGGFTKKVTDISSIFTKLTPNLAASPKLNFCEVSLQAVSMPFGKSTNCQKNWTVA